MRLAETQPELISSGQPRFRSMWERYCQGVSAIVFVVDSSLPLPDKEGASKTGKSSNMWHIASDELHTLIQSPVLAHTPLLVLATKNDLPSAASTEDVIRALYVYPVRTIADTAGNCERCETARYRATALAAKTRPTST